MLILALSVAGCSNKDDFFNKISSVFLNHRTHDKPIWPIPVSNDTLFVESDGMVYVPYEEAPEPINPSAPNYPDLSKLLDGFVVLEVFIDSTGVVKKVKVKKSLLAGPEGLDQAAVNTVRQWKFKPGLSNSKPINTIILIPIEFNNPQDKHNNKKKLFIRETKDEDMSIIRGNSYRQDIEPPDSLKYVVYETPPVPINLVYPEYTEFARKVGIVGSVKLQVFVNQYGDVTKTKVVKSLLAGRGGLDEAAQNAVKKWKFKPGMSKGKPINTSLIVPIEFDYQKKMKLINENTY